MQRVLLYLFPALIDMLLGSLFFLASVRFAESGASAVAVSSLFTVWGLSYMISAFLVGRVVTPANSRSMQMGSCIGIAACAAAFVIVPRLEPWYVIMSVLGVAVAFFFPPYMVFMKSVEGSARGDIAASTALYTASWSLGLAAGPFFAGAVWSRFGWQWVAGFDCLLALVTMAGLKVFFSTARCCPVSATKSNTAHGNMSRLPDLAWLAWFATGACVLGLAMVRGVFPSTAHRLAVPKAQQGITLALVCVGQAVVSFFLVRGRTWFYRSGPVALFGGVGLAGLAMFGLARSAAVFHAAAFCLGIHGGAAFIYMVYHALVHPSRAGRNVGINESVVGLAGIVGPALAGVLADYGGPAVPYFTAALIVALALVFQVTIHLRTAPLPAPES